jgi:hypothetical protein
MIRILDQTHFNEAVAIADLRERISGLKSKLDVDLAKTYFSKNNNGKVVFGYFENNELISWLAIKLHENKSRGKFWIIVFLFSKNSTNIFSFKKVEIKSLIQQAFIYAEELEYYDYYYSIGRRIMNAYERQWKKVDFYPLGRYDWVTLDVIPPNTKPNVEMYWLLMNQELKDDEIIIKKRSLKKSLRKEKNE